MRRLRLTVIASLTAASLLGCSGPCLIPLAPAITEHIGNDSAALAAYIGSRPY